MINIPKINQNMVKITMNNKTYINQANELKRLLFVDINCIYRYLCAKEYFIQYGSQIKSWIKENNIDVYADGNAGFYITQMASLPYDIGSLIELADIVNTEYRFRILGRPVMDEAGLKSTEKKLKKTNKELMYKYCFVPEGEYLHMDSFKAGYFETSGMQSKTPYDKTSTTGFYM